MTNTEELLKLIEARGMKMNHIAKQLGLSPAGLHKKIYNEVEFKQTEIVKMCKLLDIKTWKMRELIFFTE